MFWIGTSRTRWSSHRGRPRRLQVSAKFPSSACCHEEMMDAKCTIVVFALMMSLSHALVTSKHLRINQRSGRFHAKRGALSLDVCRDVRDRIRDVLVKDVANHATLMYSARVLGGYESHHAMPHIPRGVSPFCAVLHNVEALSFETEIDFFTRHTQIECDINPAHVFPRLRVKFHLLCMNREGKVPGVTILPKRPTQCKRDVVFLFIRRNRW